MKNREIGSVFHGNQNCYCRIKINIFLCISILKIMNKTRKEEKKTGCAMLSPEPPVELTHGDSLKFSTNEEKQDSSFF